MLQTQKQRHVPYLLWAITVISLTKIFAPLYLLCVTQLVIVVHLYNCALSNGSIFIACIRKPDKAASLFIC